MGNNWLSKYIKRYLFGDISDDEVKKRLYDNMTPHNYHFYDGESAIKRIKDAIKRNESEFDKMPVDYRHYSEYRDDIYAEYLGIPKNRRHNIENKTIVSDADYFPTIGSAENLKKINLTDLDIKTLVNSGILLKHGENKVDNSLGYYFADHTVGRGFDNNGDYISYYDKWDVNPYKGKYAHLVGTMGFVPKKVKSVEDLSFGVGNPTEYYDRVYLDDYYDIPEEARGNPFIAPAVVTAYKKGGRIHIKKKNRGKFTEYCGGKVIEECIAKGKKSKDPKIRKRATFAANARKWKHENGGILKAQEGTGNNFWSKLWTAVKEGGMAARDAKLGAIGAQQVRDLYSEGKNQEAQDLAKQYAKANTTGIALAGGAASTSLLGDLMVTGATTAADTFIDGDTDNFGKNLSLNAAFDLAGHGAGKLLRKIYPKISQEATSKIEALLKRFPEGVKSVDSVSKELKDRLIREGVDPSILTQNNLKKMVYLRSKDLLESNVPDKFAVRTNSKISNTYNLYYNADGQTRNVGYVVATPENGVGKIKMIENVTEHTPDKVRGVSELGYNAVIKDIGASKNGTVLMQPNKTMRVLDKYPDKVVVSNDGEWFNGSKYIEGNPVFQLNSPTFDVPVKYLDDFSTEGIDNSGKFLFDFTKDALHKTGGKL